VVWGARWGAIFGLVYATIALVILIFSGTKPFEAQGTTFVNTVIVYMVGGTAAGCVVGLLRPLANNRLGAAVIGFLAALPVGALASIGSRVSSFTLIGQSVVVVLFGLIVGVPAGIVLQDLSVQARRDGG
jgi:hypothetical protein